MSDNLDEDTVLLELESSIVGQQKLVKNLKTIPPTLSTFLDSVVEAAIRHGKSTEDGTIILTRKRILAVSNELERGSSPALFSRRIGALTELACDDGSTVATLTVTFLRSSRERLHHYKLADLTSLVGLPQLNDKKPKAKSRMSKNVVRLQKEMFRVDKNSIFIDADKPLNVHWHQAIFNGILDTAMRMSHKDKRQLIDVTYTFKGRPLYIRSTCSTDTGSGIAILTDQRAMRPIIGYCKKQIALLRTKLRATHGDAFVPSMIPNHFRMDIHDLCFHMGMKVLNENIDSAAAMMTRLYQTNFRVDASENEEFQDTFSLIFDSSDLASDTFEFRFLNNLDIRHENTKIDDLFGGSQLSESKPRFYTFSLEPRLFYSLVLDESPALYISHAGLSKEQSGIVQRFYNWAGNWVGRRDKAGLSNHWYEIHDFHTRLTPASRFDNFRRHLLAALEKFELKDDKRTLPQQIESIEIPDQPEVDAANVYDDSISVDIGQKAMRTKPRNNRVKMSALIYGYFVEYERRETGEFVRVYRDVNDPIIGNNSKHNQLVRKNLIEDQQYDQQYDPYEM